MIYASPNEIMPVKTGRPAIFSITDEVSISKVIEG